MSFRIESSKEKRGVGRGDKKKDRVRMLLAQRVSMEKSRGIKTNMEKMESKR